MEKDSGNLGKQHSYGICAPGSAAQVRNVGVQSYAGLAHQVQRSHQAPVADGTGTDGNPILDKLSHHFVTIPEITGILYLRGRAAFNSEGLRKQGPSEPVFGSVERHIDKPALRVRHETGR